VLNQQCIALDHGFHDFRAIQQMSITYDKNVFWQRLSYNMGELEDYIIILKVTIASFR
jgi:hypothetical protein